MARIFASKLRGMSIMTDKGLLVGQIHDMLVDEGDGRIRALVVKPESQETAQNLPCDEGGNILMPFNAVISIRDYIVVSERLLAVQQLKAR
ncbi:MAG: PRC-barrel domain-containing protein [Candidatus Hadarchaeota archaeon]|nr:PRC-barrel domain-containing protein [Candidatus Hadarchaeota archaeon]